MSLDRNGGASWQSLENPGAARKILGQAINEVDFLEQGREAYAAIEELYPICRSITGDGLRQSLRIIQKTVLLALQEVPTGTQVFDWTVPKEWNIRDAYIKNGAGERVVDFSESNLHVMSYSIPTRKRVSLAELKQHVHTLPEQPDLIPYRTSYYTDDFAFCMTHRQLVSLR